MSLAVRMIATVVTALASALTVFLGLSLPAEAAVTPFQTVSICSYDGHDHTSAHPHTAPERGPPRTYDREMTKDVVDRWSHGASACLQPAEVATAYGYDHPAPLAQVAHAAGKTWEPVRALVGDLLSLDRSGVAAKTGSSALESLAPTVRSNVDDAISRAASGKVRFPGHDGKIYNNSDDLLPRGGSYTEWTAAEAGAKRGAHRVIIDGDPASPNTIYYWDHVNPPVRVGP